MTLTLDPALVDTEPPVPDDAPNLDAPKRRGRPPGSKNRTTTDGPKPATTRTPRNTWREAEAVERHLTDLVLLASTGVGFIDPWDGRHLAINGPGVVHELVELAKEERHLRKYLELSATPGKYGPLTMSLIALIVPLLVHHRLLPGLPGPGDVFENEEGV